MHHNGIRAWSEADSGTLCSTKNPVKCTSALVTAAARVEWPDVNPKDLIQVLCSLNVYLYSTCRLQSA